VSKYDEIAALAATWTRSIFANKRECERLVLKIARDYATYLGCPLENMEFRTLDGALKITEQSVPISRPPPFVLDGEGFWHFCLRIKFDGPDPKALAHEQLRMGIRYQNGLVTIREDQDFQVNPDTPDAFQPLYDQWFEASKAEFSSPFVRQSRRIGFV
jgi:hypothetical protein